MVLPDETPGLPNHLARNVSLDFLGLCHKMWTTHNVFELLIELSTKTAGEKCRNSLTRAESKNIIYRLANAQGVFACLNGAGLELVTPTLIFYF